MITQKKHILLLLATGLLHFSVYAQRVKVAIAANLHPVMKALQADFRQRSGVSIDVISGPSGSLAAQISHGAPFDVFLSADTDFPMALWQKGFTAKQPVVYATGMLVIASTKKLEMARWKTLLTGKNIQKIAIGNPTIAPYGKAAEECLKNAGIYLNLKSKLVMGESISQVNTYITTGVVQAGFTTLSLVKDPANKTPLYWHLIDVKTYAPIMQGMVLLKHGVPNGDALKFYAYILSASAKKILAAYGYHV